MKTILFIHSAGPQAPQQGSYDFVHWLRRSLGATYRVHYPLMHDPETPEYGAWKEQLERELILLGEELIIVGHSLGGSVVLKYLSEEKISSKIKALFLVATPFWGVDEEWQVGDYVLKAGFEKNLPDIPMKFYHSIEDQWVPASHTTLYRKKLPNATTTFLEGSDHAFEHGLPALLADLRAVE